MAQPDNHGVTFLYPSGDQPGAAYSLDIINVQYISPFSKPLLYTFCNKGNRQISMQSAVPFNGTVPVLLNFNATTPCYFDLRPDTAAGNGANSDSFILLPTPRAQAATLGLSSSSTSTSVPTSASTSTNGAAGTANANAGLSDGAKAGIGVGVAIAVIAVAALSFGFWWRRRRASKKSPAVMPPPTSNWDKPPSTDPSWGAPEQHEYYKAHELRAKEPPQELAGQPVTHELSSPSKPQELPS